MRGRKPKLNEAHIEVVRKLKAEGWTNAKIADHLGIHRSNLQTFISKHKIRGDPKLPEIPTDKHKMLVQYARKAAYRLSRYYSDKYVGFDRFELESRLMWESFVGYTKWTKECHLSAYLQRRFEWIAMNYVDQLIRQQKRFAEYRELARHGQVYIY